MFRNILVPTDGSPLSEKAMNAAIELARNNPGCAIVGLSFAEPLPAEVLRFHPLIDTAKYNVHEHILAEKRAEKIALMANAAGIPCETVVKKSDQPHMEIIRAARHYQSDCIFMPGQDSNEHGNYFIDGKFQKVLSQANIPVLVYR